MLPKRLLVLFFVSTLVIGALPVLAQDEAPAEEEELTSAIKKIALSIEGGWYSGTTFLSLPAVDARAQLAEGSNFVTLFNGEELDLGIEREINDLDGPEKRILSGDAFGGRIGFYLSDAFHIDLTGSYSSGRATISMLRFEDSEQQERVEGDELLTWVRNLPKYQSQAISGGFTDDGFKSYMFGFGLAYDAYPIRTLGVVPYFGTGFGGVINRFTTLEDKTALYFRLYGGLMLPLGDSAQLSFRAAATTYSFATEEVGYAEQVTSATLNLGLTWFFDVKPIY